MISWQIAEKFAELVGSSISVNQEHYARGVSTFAYSKSRQICEQISVIYGGEVKPSIYGRWMVYWHNPR